MLVAGVHFKLYRKKMNQVVEGDISDFGRRLLTSNLQLIKLAYSESSSAGSRVYICQRYGTKVGKGRCNSPCVCVCVKWWSTELL